MKSSSILMQKLQTKKLTAETLALCEVFDAYRTMTDMRIQAMESKLNALDGIANRYTSE